MSDNLYHEIILSIMRRERESYWQRSLGKYPHRMPTFRIRKYFNDESVLELNGKEMLRAMVELCKQGYVVKHADSRIGQAYWQLTERE